MNQNRIREVLPALAEACRATRGVQARLTEITAVTKDDRSPVTVADFAAQAIVADRLFAIEGAKFNLVGEENSDALRASPTLADTVVEVCRTVWPEADRAKVIEAIDRGNHDASAPAYWTLDPIDGTKGFLRGAQYAIALAYIEDGRVDCGALGCPNLSPDLTHSLLTPPANGTLYHATRGGGAFVTRIESSDTAEPIAVAGAESGIVRMCESVESSHSKHDDTARVLEHLALESRAVRIDSQCKYAVVARGQADAYVRMPTRKDYVERIWDHAAGMVVATEAGAVVTDVDGRPLDFGHGTGLERNRGIVCAHPDYHAGFVAAIAELGL